MSNLLDFDDFTSSNNDPTSDFLARERAALGGDADFFNSFDDSSFTSPSTISVSTPDYIKSTPKQQNDFTTFESNFPKTENLESSRAFHKALLPEEEPDVVRQWREKHRESIAKKDEIEQEKKQQVINRAREDIDRFYEEYNDKKQKAIEENREKEEKRLKSRELDSTENIWTSVLRECNVTNAKATYPTRDVTRMKSLLLDLKKDNHAPGIII